MATKVGKDVLAFRARVAARLKSLRLERGLSQRDLADRSKVWPDFISQVETGAKQASLDTLYRLAKGLGVSPADILSDL